MSWCNHVVCSPLSLHARRENASHTRLHGTRWGAAAWLCYATVNGAPCLAALKAGGLPQELEEGFRKYAFKKTAQEDAGISVLKKLLLAYAKHNDSQAALAAARPTAPAAAAAAGADHGAAAAAAVVASPAASAPGLPAMEVTDVPPAANEQPAAVAGAPPPPGRNGPVLRGMQAGDNIEAPA